MLASYDLASGNQARIVGQLPMLLICLPDNPGQH